VRVTWFNAGELPQPGERVDVAFHLGLDHWRGRERAALELVDWRPAAPPARETVARLVAGRDVIDWRGDADAGARLAALREALGGELAAWAEGVVSAPIDTVTRWELRERAGSVQALAVLTAPPSGSVLRGVLAVVRPHSVYLLPPLAVPAIAPSAFVRQVAGMLRVALRAHGGVVDVERMAARVAARDEAVMAALHGLELSGSVVLRRENGVLRAYLPGQAPPEEELNGAEAEDEAPEEREARLRSAYEQVQHALTYLLCETEAFRRAYSTLTVEALLGAD